MGSVILIPPEVASVINGAFLPTSPNKMRDAAPKVVSAAHDLERAPTARRAPVAWHYRLKSEGGNRILPQTDPALIRTSGWRAKRKIEPLFAADSTS